MFGQAMFGAVPFGASCCCDEQPPPTPTVRSGGPGDARSSEWREKIQDDDDVALITALLDL